MERRYSAEKSVQIVVSLLKQKGIKKIVISPGTTNIGFVVSVQNDPFFEIYSCVDERSAAYMACGLAYESGESVVLSCTGATASRNYFPALTEAFYSKLPILALTSSQHDSQEGNLSPQYTLRKNPPADTVRHSVTLPIVRNEEDFWDCTIKVNRALLELKREGGGPVHINIQTGFGVVVGNLPEVVSIDRVTLGDEFPELPSGRIAVFVGYHKKFSPETAAAVEAFAVSHDAVVFCDHTSSYFGQRRFQAALLFAQQQLDKSAFMPDLLIHIGQVSGDYCGQGLRPKNVWRVGEDGQIRDRFKKLTKVFQMSERSFFEFYTGQNTTQTSEYFDTLVERKQHLEGKIPDLPFSTIWAAQVLSQKIPEDCFAYFAILHNLRSFNFFELPAGVESFSNTGGFGIDGGVSACVGASFAARQRLHFCFTGDLAFFYDMNAIGNRDISGNLRVFLVNNGLGAEMALYTSPVYAAVGDEGKRFLCAKGHFAGKSRELVRHYAEDLGFEYLCAETKDEFLKAAERFCTPVLSEKPMLFEIFTDEQDESDALKIVNNLETDAKFMTKLAMEAKSKELAHKILGNKGVKVVKAVLGKE